MLEQLIAICRMTGPQRQRRACFGEFGLQAPQLHLRRAAYDDVALRRQGEGVCHVEAERLPEYPHDLQPVRSDIDDYKIMIDDVGKVRRWPDDLRRQRVAFAARLEDFAPERGWPDRSRPR